MPSELKRSRLATTLAITALATAACGTRLPASKIDQAQASSSDLTGIVAPTASADGGATVTPESSSAPTSDLSSGEPGAAPTTTSDAGTSSIGGSGAGLSTKTTLAPIPIGVLTVTGASSYQASLGFKGATGDQTAMTKSVVAYINAHGGMNGHKIQLLSYDVSPQAAATNEDSAMQAACTYFTQDNHVKVIASYVALAPETFYKCLAKAHVPVVTPDEGVSSDYMSRYGSTLYMPAGPSYTRLLSDSVDALWAKGWLTSTSTVGVVGYDTIDVHDIVTNGLAPALQRHGLKLATGMYTSTSSTAASEYTGGVLSFKSKHVDRVFFAPGGEPIYFALIAAQQGYHPRYELGSLEYPSVLTSNLPASQLSGSMGLGWLPYLDLPSDKWGTVTTPGIAQCRKAVAAANQDFTSGTTLGIAAWICDDWFFLQDTFATGVIPDEAGIRHGVESLGASFRSAATFSTLLAPGRTHDGASGYRLVAFGDTCKCYSYTTSVQKLS